MTRSEFLALTGFALGRLKGLQQKRLLPFDLPSEDSKWSRIDYSPFHAAMLVAYAELTAGGMSAELAAKVILERRDELIAGPIVSRPGERKGETLYGRGGIRALIPTDSPANDVWVGVADREDCGEPVIIFGTVAEIAKDLADGRFVIQVSDGSFGRLFLTNLTQAMRTVDSRAKELNIKLFPTMEDQSDATRTGKV